MKRETYETETEWLADRANHLGASETPGILGHGYADDSAMSTYAKKVNPTLDEVIDATLQERFEIGHLQEPVMRELFQRRTGLSVKHIPFEVCVSEQRPYLAATLDGQVCDDDGMAVWEAKNVDAFLAPEWDEACPLKVQIQVHHQMYVTGYRRAYIAALIGGNRLVWMRLDRNERFIDAMLPALDTFWECVTTRTPPLADGSNATARALSRLYAEDDGETIQLPLDAVDWDAKLQAVKAEIKELKANRTALENQIKAEIKTATYGEIPGGGRYSWKSADRKGYTVEPTITRTLRRLKR